MTKTNGLGDRLFVSGVELSGDTQSYLAGGGHAVLDVTGIDRSAMERIGGVRDGRITWTSYFNPTRAHPVLKTLPTADVPLTLLRGSALGAPAAVLVAKQIGYDGTRGNDGAFTFALEAQTTGGDGLAWGVQLAPNGVRTDTTTTNGASLDGATDTTVAWRLSVVITAFTGTTITFALQDSADGTTWGPVGSLVMTAVGQGTKTGTGTVRRYVRVATNGTFTSVTYCPVVARW